MLERIILLPHNDMWRATFAREAEALQGLLQANLLDVLHVGSTAIANVSARPTVDILGVVASVNSLDSHRDELAGLGYDWLGESGLWGERFFVKKDSHGKESVHLRFFDTESHEIVQMEGFCDYLKKHQALARQYSQYKLKIAEKFVHDITKYNEYKLEFIKEVLKRAGID